MSKLRKYLMKSMSHPSKSAIYKLQHDGHSKKRRVSHKRSGSPKPLSHSCDVHTQSGHKCRIKVRPSVAHCRFHKHGPVGTVRMTQGLRKRRHFGPRKPSKKFMARQSMRSLSPAF
jgi:hypothetical protein